VKPKDSRNCSGASPPRAAAQNAEKKQGSATASSPLPVLASVTCKIPKKTQQAVDFSFSFLCFRSASLSPFRIGSSTDRFFSFLFLLLCFRWSAVWPRGPPAARLLSGLAGGDGEEICCRPRPLELLWRWERWLTVLRRRYQRGRPVYGSGDDGDGSVGAAAADGGWICNRSVERDDRSWLFFGRYCWRNHQRRGCWGGSFGWRSCGMITAVEQERKGQIYSSCGGRWRSVWERRGLMELKRQRGVLGSVLLAGKGKEDGERCAGWVGKRLFWDRVLFSREGATAWADQRQGRGLCDGLLAVEGKKLGRLRWVGGGCLGSDGFRFRVCFVSPFFFKIAPPLKNECSLVFIGKVLLGFQTSPSTFPFLLFSSFFVNFYFSYFLYFWKRANINIDSMRKINDFKNDAWKVERVPNVFENFNSFWDDAKNAKNDTNV